MLNVVRNFLLKRVLEDFLWHSKEREGGSMATPLQERELKRGSSRGGAQEGELKRSNCRQAGRQASRLALGRHSVGAMPGGACFFSFLLLVFWLFYLLSVDPSTSLFRSQSILPLFKECQNLSIDFFHILEEDGIYLYFSHCCCA